MKKLLLAVAFAFAFNAFAGEAKPTEVLPVEEKAAEVKPVEEKAAEAKPAAKKARKTAKASKKKIDAAPEAAPAEGEATP